jgi:hypothetical protein
VDGFLNGEFITSEFLVTCLKLLEVLRGPSPVAVEVEEEPASSEGLDEGRRGEDTPSRLLICSGDQPFADELMMESRAALETAVPLCRLRRVPGDGWGEEEDMSLSDEELEADAGRGVRTVNGMVGDTRDVEQGDVRGEDVLL